MFFYYKLNINNTRCMETPLTFKVYTYKEFSNDYHSVTAYI